MSLLEYENQMFLDAFHEDGLLVTARGLGIQRIFINCLKLYSDPGNLVLVLNTTSQEEEYLMEKLEELDTKPLPKILTNECSTNDRRSIYMEGGVIFVTSRILVVDLLTDRVPTDLITGILVYKAHKILESCQEAFILRLYRQKNKKGFIKAFSDSPQSFTAGFCHVERVMKSLFVRKLFLWPRFHASVVSTFEKNKIDVVELHVQMTPPMVACQTALLDLINACIKELKRGNPSLDTDEVTVENAITRSFDKIIRLHLDPVWHQLGGKTKQLVSDLKTLKLLLEYLTQYDCVNFYNFVNSLRSSERNFGKNSGWLFLNAADSLFVHARSRIYQTIDEHKKQRTGNGDQTTAKPKSKKCLEECPKWKALADVLKEIEEDNKDVDPDLGPGRVLVAVQDDRTCSQIREYLCEGAKSLLERLFDKTIAMKAGQQRKELYKKYQKGKGKGKGNTSGKSADSLTLTQMVGTSDDESSNKGTDASLPDDLIGVSPDAYYGVIKEPITILHPLHGSTDPFTLIRTLNEIQPRYVVMYDMDMMFVRQLEVFKASRPGLPLRVYFLMYAASTEEQRYLTSLRKEKEAFEFLIREKATMVIPEEREGRLEDDPDLSRDVTPANETVNTRKGGLQSATTTQKIIVDMREFRSELPSLIHRRGIEIEPCTIEVGDYILTPEICVERKSLSDLIGSLNNGRLYNQAISMCRYYKRPVLLIEFDANKSFVLQGKYQMGSEISSNDVSSRLTLLTIHFPRLRILWCQSPYATAELFEELKKGRPQPDAATAMAIQGETESELLSGKYTHGPQDMLLKMPGISSKNVHMIMNAVENIAELVTLSENDISKILGNDVNAQKLYQFLHQNYIPTDTGPVKNTHIKRLPLRGKRKR